MRAVINRFSIDDMRGPDHWVDNPKEFCVLVDMLIADKKMDGGDIFTVVACSPKWFENHVLKPKRVHPTHEQVSNYAFGRHHLFLEEFDADVIEDAVAKIVSSAEGNDWNEIALYLARFFSWEFEDYEGHLES